MPIARSASIHATAVVADGAEIGENVSVGPFCVVGEEVVLGAGVELKSHAVVTGWTEVGEKTVIFPFACVGEVPQDLKYRGERTRLVIGRRNRIREGATLNCGTDLGGGLTSVGDDCLFMTGSHVGHDCRVGNGIIMANCAALGGHCEISDNVIIGGLSGVHQHVRIGKGAFVGAVTMVTRDVLPYGLVQGPTGILNGLNLVGLRRRNAERGEIRQLSDAYEQIAVAEKSLSAVIRDLEDAGNVNGLVADVIEFVRSNSDRSFLLPVKRSGLDES